MMRSLTSDCVVRTELGQAAAQTGGHLASNRKVGRMQKSVPCQGDTLNNSPTPRSGQEAWVHQEVGGTPEGPAHLGLPATEEHAQREGCLLGGREPKACSDRSLCTCAERALFPIAWLLLLCAKRFRREGLLREGCLRRDSWWGVGGPRAVSWVSLAVLYSLTGGPVGITVAPHPWPASRKSRLSTNCYLVLITGCTNVS